MKIFDLNITKTNKEDFLKDLYHLKGSKIIFTPNPEILLESKKDKTFKKILEKANYLIPDGIGIFLAFQILSNNRFGIFNLFLLPYYLFNLFFRRKYLYEKYGDRICGSDLTNYLLDYAEKNNIEVSIIDLYSPINDLKSHMQKTFKERVNNKFKKLKMDYYVYDLENKKNIIEKIKKSKSKILFSTLGMKKQEESIVEIMGKCNNLKLGLGVGSSFDYIIGFQKRAPIFFRTLGLEWLYRLFTGPRKINRLKRLWNAIFVFTWFVILN